MLYLSSYLCVLACSLLALYASLPISLGSSNMSYSLSLPAGSFLGFLCQPSDCRNTHGQEAYSAVYDAWGLKAQKRFPAKKSHTKPGLVLPCTSLSEMKNFRSLVMRKIKVEKSLKLEFKISEYRFMGNKSLKAML